MKIHQSMWVDTVTIFTKTWTKSHWPLDDLWPHVCWGHMCDSTQGSLCPSPIGMHQLCEYSDQFCKNIPHTTYIHTTYYVHVHILRTEWVIIIIISFWTQFRRHKKFKIKRPQLDFNGALEVSIMNIIPFHFIHDIQTINPFIFNLNRCLIPQNGINMLWDFLFTHKRRADFIKNIFWLFLEF